MRKSFRLGLLRALVAAVGACTAAWAAWRGYRGTVGAPDRRFGDHWHLGQRVLDRKGRILRELPSPTGGRGRGLDLRDLGERIVLATLAAEDSRFFAHDGIDRQAVLRAAAQNVRHARVVSGASTITQQLVKLVDHAGEPRPGTLAAKLREAARAQNLEESVTKTVILEAYLNRLGYGHGLVGPEAAARGYFGVAASELSWAQAAYLAVLPRAPSYLDPFVHPRRVESRQTALLESMHERGVLTDGDLERARNEPVAPRPLARPFHAPHFVEALRSEDRLGREPVVRTTLDLDLQREVEGLVRTHVATLIHRGASDAAVLVVDNATGDVLAYVGSADFHDPAGGQVDMVRARRQPGSALKPFVYARAFAHGAHAAQMVADVPTSFGEDGRGTYAPHNFDRVFHGPISAREALAGSLNVPAVRLAAELRPGELLDSLRDLGLSSLDRDASHYGLALALGSGEVQLRELAGAYAALARAGETIELRMLRSDRAATSRILGPEVAASITEILSDPTARIRGLHGRGPFDLGFPVAVKTGTSSGYRDAWTVGYTRERTVAVWVGNADGSPTRELTGAAAAGPLFADVMRRAMEDVEARRPLWDPGLLVETAVCPLSGRAVAPACPGRVIRLLPRSLPRLMPCDVHVHATRTRATAGIPWRCDSAASSTIAVLPDVFGRWLAEQPSGAPGRDPDGLPWYPRSRVPDCQEARAPRTIEIESPAPGSVFVLSRNDAAEHQALEVRATVSGGEDDDRIGPVQILVDGEVAATSAIPVDGRVQVTPGAHELVVRPVDPRAPIRVARTTYTVR